MSVHGPDARCPRRAALRRQEGRRRERQRRPVQRLRLSTDGVGDSAGGAVPATLSLTLGTAAAFGAFVPGVDRGCTATTTASVVSTAGDATWRSPMGAGWLAAASSTERSRWTTGCGRWPPAGAAPARACSPRSATRPRAVELRRSGQRRRGLDRLPPADHRRPGPAHRRLRQDADLHAPTTAPSRRPGCGTPHKRRTRHAASAARPPRSGGPLSYPRGDRPLSIPAPVTHNCKPRTARPKSAGKVLRPSTGRDSRQWSRSAFTSSSLLIFERPSMPISAARFSRSSLVRSS